MEILNIVLAIVVLVVAVWVAIFGGVGALLSNSRGSSSASGFAWGTLLGPFGWVAVLWLTRESARAPQIEPMTPLGAESQWGKVDPWDE